MGSVATDLAGFLASNGVGELGASTGWSINIDGEPMDPQNTVTVYNTGGPGPDTDELDVHYPTIQVRVKSTGHALAVAKHDQIRGLFHGLVQLSLGGAVYYSVTASSDVLSLGRDDNNLYLFVVNYTVIRQLT